MPSITNKLAIFGGSGMTGLVVVEEALSLGLGVRLLLRPSSQFPAELASKTEIIRGDVTDREAVKDTITGCFGVVVALGTRNNLEETSVMSTGVKNILAAMEEKGIKQISVCLSTFLLMPEERVPAMFHAINREHARMLVAVKRGRHIQAGQPLEASTADWVAVMPPHIADIPRTQFLVKEGALPGGRTVSKRDLACFLVQSLTQPEFRHKRMAISSETT